MTNSDINSELHQAALDAAAGKFDPKRAAEACDRMDRMREELRKRIGVVNIAVDLIREARGEI